MNFWIKTHADDKITRNKVVRNKLALTKENTIAVLQQACHEMDVPTPIITKSHFDNIDKFNFVKFRKSDFVESVDFDYMVVENFVEK